MVSINPVWSTKHRALAWVTFAIYFVGLVLFLVSYVGNNWYNLPVENNEYPPDNEENFSLKFGLFYMCYRGHCKYDLRQDYFVVNRIPQSLSITYAYQHYRATCMALETIAASVFLLTMGSYMAFLSGFKYSVFMGYVTGGLAIIAGVFSLAGVIVFGKWFRGSTRESPFGWSFGLIIIAFCILILNAIATIILTIVIQRNRQSVPPPFSSSASESMMQSKSFQ